jgi:hypothetical protein
MLPAGLAVPLLQVYVLSCAAAGLQQFWQWQAWPRQRESLRL